MAHAYGISVDCIAAVAKQYGHSEFNSPRRSTVPMLDYWRDWDDKLAIFSDLTGLNLSRSASLGFEYAVNPPSGRGKPSFTDLMIKDGDLAIAIEAKYLEPPYETCAEWLGNPTSKNREEVLGGWLELISGKAGRSLGIQQVLDIPYQALHRTASACSVASDRAVTIYQIFEPSKRPYYAAALGKLAAVTGDSVQFGILESGFVASEVYQNLMRRWDAGERELASDVVAALAEGPLCAFEQDRFEHIVKCPD